MNFILKTIDDLSQIKENWTELLSNAVTRKIFLHPIYQQTWWETLGKGRLKIITIRDEGEKLVGLAPLFANAHQLGFVGCKDVSDYLDFIVYRDCHQEVYEHLAKAIINLVDQEQITEAEFCSIPAFSPTLQYLPELLQSIRPTIKFDIQRQDVCPVIQLPNNFDSYLNSLDRKQRHEIRRKERRLIREAGFRIEVVDKLDFAFDPVKTFIHLHQLSSPNKHEFWSDQHRQFFETLLPKLAKQGWLKLFFLHIDHWLENSFDLPLPKRPIAAMLIFDYDDVYNLYNSGYDPKYRQLSAGQVLTTLTIQHAIQNRKTVYDFLRGDEEYKFRLGGKPEAIFDLKIYFQ